MTIRKKTISNIVPDTTRDIATLNEALGGEYFGMAAYEAAIGTGLLDEGVVEVAKSFRQDHSRHADRLREAITKLGGKPVDAKTWETYASEAPPPPLKSQADVLRYAVSLESGATSASVASVAEFCSPELAVMAAQIAGVEAMHWSTLLSALGEDPVPASFIPLPNN